MSDKPTRTVRVRATVEYDLTVPIDWSDSDVLFHRNEGTFCGDTLVDELQDQVQLDSDGDDYRPCLCGVVQYEVLESPEWFKIRDRRLYYTRVDTGSGLL